MRKLKNEEKRTLITHHRDQYLQQTFEYELQMEAIRAQGVAEDDETMAGLKEKQELAQKACDRMEVLLKQLPKAPVPEKAR